MNEQKHLDKCNNGFSSVSKQESNMAIDAQYDPFNDLLTKVCE